MNIVLLLFFFPFINADLRPDTASCVNQYNDTVISLKSDEIIYFESEDYPKSIASNSGCRHTFKRADGEKTGFIVVLINGFLSSFNLIPNMPYGKMTPESRVLATPLSNTITGSFDDSKSVKYIDVPETDSIPFEIPKYFIGWNGFQGFVYAPPLGEKTSSCLLNGQIFNLVDSNKIVPLMSLGTSVKYEVCSWKIVVPESMRLKVIVRRKLDRESLTISNDNGPINVLRNNTVYYFDGASFTITYRKNFLSMNQTFSMVALVSAASFTPKTYINCSQSFADGTIIIQVQNNTIGYLNNIICDVPLLLQDGQNVFLEISSFLEPIADKIVIKDTKGNDNNIDQRRKILLPQSGNYTFRFESDENTNAYGFIAKASYFDCTCKHIEKKLSCYEDGFGLTSSIPSYCGSMNCEFDVTFDQSCTDKFFFFKTTTQLRKGDVDVLEISVDGNLIYKTSSSEFMTFGRLFSKNQTLHVKFTSGNDVTDVYTDVPTLWFSSVASSNSELIALTPESPIFKSPVDMNNNTYFSLTVQAPSNYTLDVFLMGMLSSHEEVYDAYLLAGSSYNEISMKYPRFITSYTSTTGQVTLPLVNYYYMKYFFRLREIYAKNCLDNNNAIETKYKPHNLTFEDRAEDHCLMAFLFSTGNSYEMEVSYTTASLSSNVTFYKEADLSSSVGTTDNVSAKYTNISTSEPIDSVLPRKA